MADLLSGSTNVPLKANPAKYDSEGLTVDQHFATSADGTKIPYFVIRRADIELDGSNPTLVDAYVGGTTTHGTRPATHHPLRTAPLPAAAPCVHTFLPTARGPFRPLLARLLTY